MVFYMRHCHSFAMLYWNFLKSGHFSEFVRNYLLKYLIPGMSNTEHTFLHFLPITYSCVLHFTLSFLTDLQICNASQTPSQWQLPYTNIPKLLNIFPYISIIIIFFSLSHVALEFQTMIFMFPCCWIEPWLPSHKHIFPYTVWRYMGMLWGHSVLINKAMGVFAFIA